LPRPESSVVEDNFCTQITLVGPNLLEAWNELSFTRGLENACPPENWSPLQHAGIYVYHGTAAHLGNEAFINGLADRPFNGLVGKSNPNQITPGKDSIPIIWTSFSPFRAFLWAAFRADVIRNVPGMETLSNLSSEWEFAGTTYKGVLLLQFASVQPSPPGCSQYTIPVGQEENWAAIAAASRAVPAGEATTKLWRRFRTIHQQSVNSEWPDVVHGLELPAARNSLRTFTRQYWRSVWFSGGIQDLNSRHQKTMAIQYIFESASMTPPPQRKSSKRTKISGTIRKRLSQVFRKMNLAVN
jgi:hypothetical protein